MVCITWRYVIARYKKIPKQKKKTDENTKEWIIHIWEWLEPRLKTLLIILVAVLLVIAVVWVAVKRKESKNLKAQLEYFEIMKVEDEAARNLKLEDFVKEHEGEEVVYQVMMRLGEYNYKKGNLEEAAKYYKNVIDDTAGELMYYLALDAIAPVYAELGKAERAAELYENASNLSSDPNPFLSKLNAAKYYNLAGNKDKAKEIYEGLIADEKTPPSTKIKAEEQLLWIALSK